MIFYVPYCQNITPDNRSSYTFLKPPMQGVRTLNTRNGKKQNAATHHDNNINTSNQKKTLKASPNPEFMLILKVMKKQPAILICFQTTSYLSWWRFCY